MQLESAYFEHYAGITGFTYSPGDYTQAAQQVTQLITQPELRERMGAGACCGTRVHAIPFRSSVGGRALCCAIYGAVLSCAVVLCVRLCCGVLCVCGVTFRQLSCADLLMTSLAWSRYLCVMIS